MLSTEMFEVFRKPSADALAQRELDNDRRMLLETQRNKDYYTKMVDFYETRIRNLAMQLKKSEK